MKKSIIFLLFPLLLVSCGTKESDSAFVNKTNYGIEPVFDDPLGIYDKDPSVFSEDSKEYLFYTTNEKAFESKDVISLRTGEEKEGKMTYSKREIVLRPSENSWDSNRVSNPSVIKGVFPYQSHEYSYLMAYQGTSKVKDKLYQIGFAVSDNLTDWTKVGEEPALKYSSYAYGSSYGLGAPSLVSYDEKGKFYLFYTYADSLITTTRVSYFEFTASGEIKTTEPSAVSKKGLEDKSGDVLFNNADMMLDKTSGELYCVRDRNPVLSKPATSDSVQVSKADIAILSDPNSYEWEIVRESISDLDTAVMDGSEEQEFGWERIFSSCFVRDPYGRKTEKLSLALTVSDTGEGKESDDYQYSGAIVKYDLE